MIKCFDDGRFLVHCLHTFDGNLLVIIDDCTKRIKIFSTDKLFNNISNTKHASYTEFLTFFCDRVGYVKKYKSARSSIANN